MSPAAPFLVVLAVIATAHVVEAQEAVVPTEVADRDYYPWITSLTAGPVCGGGSVARSSSGDRWAALAGVS